MTDDQNIDYESLTRDAMRGVMRAVLQRVAATGLPGDHHFYIAFSTRAAGVGLSRRLREKYPDEMTIVLQHRFWDLAVREDRFEVKLTFDGIPELLSVPFAAVKVFFDPSVQYGLQFEDSDGDADTSRRPLGSRRMAQPESADDEVQPAAPRLPGRAPPADKRRPVRKPRPERVPDRAVDPASGPTAGQPPAQQPPAPVPAAVRPTPLTASPAATHTGKPASTGAASGASPPRPASDDAGASDADGGQDQRRSDPVPKPETPGAKIVNIENFRKK